MNHTTDYRIFVEKLPRFRVEAESLRRELNTNLNLALGELRLLNVYDLFGFSEELLEKTRYTVFGEVVTDSVTDSCDLGGRKYIAVECLPGQFDQRAASAVDCVRLIDPAADVRIRSSKLLLFEDGTTDEELEKIQLEQGRATIDRLVEANDFDPEVSEMLRNVLTLSETLTREIMVPRTDMICMDRTATLADMLRLCSRSGFSRVPVIGDDVDDLIGVAYLKDAVRATAFNPAASQRYVASIVRQPMLVPESKPVDDLFHAMQQTRQHVAIVVDEYGGIAGLVTIEDTIEQIVGELEDEHDRTQHSEPEKIGERKWKMPARTPIATLEEMFEIDIDEDDVDTVYGLLTKLLGRVPIVGSSAVTRGLRLTAVDTAGRRKRVSMIVVEPAAGSQGPAADDDEPRSDEQDGESASPQGE